MRELVELVEKRIFRFTAVKCTFGGADDGIRTHTPFSRERILSPLRLPFRHIGGLNSCEV